MFVILAIAISGLSEVISRPGAGLFLGYLFLTSSFLSKGKPPALKLIG